MKPSAAPAPSAPELVLPRAAKAEDASGGRRPLFLILLLLALAGGGFYGWKKVHYALLHEDTDNAQVEGHVSPVLPRVSGYVTRVRVDDNQRVEAGQTLVEIDAAELDLKIAGARAALETAGALLKTAEAMRGNSLAARAVAEANTATAAVTQAKAAADFARDSQLLKGGALTDRELADAKSAAEAASAQLEAARRQTEAATAQVEVAETQIGAARAHLAQSQAEFDYAVLQRSYARVTAPIGGLVSRKNVEPGQYVQAGQTLLSVSSDTDLWVVANFKETQLTDVHTGQPVEFSVDSYPGTTFHGKVDSIAGATGARFALLPPDNSTGNFVKVTQRVPVKITLAQPADAAHVLRPGMSVFAAVQVRK